MFSGPPASRPCASQVGGGLRPSDAQAAGMQRRQCRRVPGAEQLGCRALMSAANVSTTAARVAEGGCAQQQCHEHQRPLAKGGYRSRWRDPGCVAHFADQLAGREVGCQANVRTCSFKHPQVGVLRDGGDPWRARAIGVPDRDGVDSRANHERVGVTGWHGRAQGQRNAVDGARHRRKTCGGAQQRPT